MISHLNDLPLEIIYYIYEFDDTYRILYHECIKEFKKYFNNYGKKTSVYDTELIPNPEDNTIYIYTKMELKYEYINDKLINDFNEYILFYLKNKNY